MIATDKPRRRRARLAGTLAAGVFAVGAVGLGATGCQTTSTAAAAVAPASTAGAAGAAAAAGVAWSKVGPGWELAQYTTGADGKHAPVTLYLISPAGERWALYTWGAHDNAPYMIGWSGDKKRALFIIGSNQYEQLTLATGQLSRGALPARAEPIGYAGPGGRNILGVTGGNSSTLARYSLAGRLLKKLTRGVDETSAVYAANGDELAVSWNKGLELVSNGGGVLRSLPVPGTDPVDGCTATRWWNATTLLATCLAKGAFSERLWLVPTNGKRPVPLTPQRTGRVRSSANDNGDLDAWRLASGLYLQSTGDVPCTNGRIYRQAANRSITEVAAPNTNVDADQIVTALGPRLLMDTTSGCLEEEEPVTTSQLWYDPATHAEQWVLRAPAGAAGLVGAVAYDSTENAPGF